MKRTNESDSVGDSDPYTNGNGEPSAESAPEAIGESDLFLDFQERLARVAKVLRPVLLVGEPGTGKELAASRLHFLSPRWKEPFVKLNCAALAPNILESELFGHEVGAFTGAARRRLGRFEVANGGTMFLDEIGQMPIPLQEKILRVVEYGTFERVGSSETVSVDVRIIGATNADLLALVDEGKFKRDLLDRLSFEVLFIPPLRKRGVVDIRLLSERFAQRMSKELGFKKLPKFAEDAWEKLFNYDWPGNVRELKNVVERAVYQAGEHSIHNLTFDPFGEVPEDFFHPLASVHTRYSERSHSTHPEEVESNVSSHSTLHSQLGNVRTNERPHLPLNLIESVEDFERSLLELAFDHAQGNQRRAAELLGITYDQWRGLFRKYGETSERLKSRRKNP